MRSMAKGILIGALVAGSAFGAMAFCEPPAQETPVETVENLGPDLYLPPCPTEGEDISAECYWDASTRGDGNGTSFIMHGGQVYYPEGSGF